LIFPTFVFVSNGKIYSRERLAAQERAEKEKLELEKKKEREIQLKKEMEKIREQVMFTSDMQLSCYV
jgi:cell shape-determining protein MreC